MLKFNVKRFCQQTLLSFRNISTLNQLIYFTMTNYEKFSPKDYVNAFKLFENLKGNEEEYQVKFYELMDYAFLNEKNFSDLDYLKSLLDLYLINRINNNIYSDYIANQTIKRNIQIFHNPSNFLYFIKKFNEIGCKNVALWSVFEEAFFEVNSHFTMEQTLIIITILIDKKGSNRFLDFSLNFLFNKEADKHKLCYELLNHFIKNLKEYTNSSIRGKIIIFINQTLSSLMTNDVTAEDASKIFPTLLNINDMSSELELPVIEKLKDKFLKQINSQIDKLSPETLTNLINELYVVGYDKLDKNEIIKCLVNSDKTNDFKTNLTFLKYLSLFPEMKNHPEIEKISNDDLFWEDSIEELYHFSLEEEIELFRMLLHYEVKYPRIWIILQTFLKEHLTKTKDINKIVLILDLIKPQSEEEVENPSKSLVFKPFIFSIENLLEKIKVEKSHNLNVNKL